MDDPVYYLELEGRQVGPYDRRTIVGMRIKGTLGSDHALVTAQGVRLTVADLLRREAPSKPFNPALSGSYSLVQATYTATLIEAEGPGPEVPAFKGEIEARVQSDVLRLAGRFRQGMAWKEDRVKLPMHGIVHARLRTSCVDLWVRHDGHAALQRVSLDLITPEAAGEFVDWLPRATPWPGTDAAAPARSAEPSAANHTLVWSAVVGTVAVVGAVLAWVLSRP